MESEHTYNEQTLTSIIDTTRDAVIMIDGEGLVRLWNRAAEEIFGYRRDEVMGKELHPLIANSDQLEAYRREIVGFKKTGRGPALGKTLELKGLRKSGEEITVDLSLNSLMIGGRWHAVGIVRDVTEKSEIGRRLKESEAFYHNIYDSMDTAVFVVDVEPGGGYRLTGINATHERLTGLCNAEVAGKRLEEFLTPEIAGDIRSRYDACLTAGTLMEYEEMLPFRGVETWWITRLMPVRDDDGAIYRLLGTSTSITERKAMEQRMHDTLEFIQAIISNSPLGIATYRTNGECINANGSYVSIIGAPDMRAVLRQNFHEIPSWKESGLYDGAMEALQSGEPKRQVIEMNTTFGKSAWLGCYLIPFSMKDELRLLMMIDDISLIKKSELAAREGIMFVHSLIDTIPNPIYYTDIDGMLIGCNSSFERFTGRPKIKILGRRVADITDAATAELHRRMDRELKEHPPRQVFETTLRDSGGTERYIQFFRGIFTTEGDIPAGIIGVMLDITERKRNEDMLRELSLMDSLTGLGNRRNFEDMLAAEWSRAIRQGDPLSLIFIDIDYFKRYNDTLGHQEGDRCLATVAEAIKSSCHRGGDFPARYGGEEFVVLLPKVPPEGAMVVAERIRAAVIAMAIPHAASPVSGVVTISAGIATVYPSKEKNRYDLVFLADSALYRAKAGGRNRVES
ncbi:MAG: PAS domain S-box protein [Spirochaetes bacterium]|nr:PAS domain S-box protein [Spirochaetota bacterium]